MSYSAAQKVIELAPELELRVRQPDGRDLIRPVRDGLTLGRSQASDLVVDDPAAELLHARIVSGTDGRARLICFGRTAVALPDGTAVTQLDLDVGTAFFIGMSRCDVITLGSAAAPSPAGESSADESTVGESSLGESAAAAAGVAPEAGSLSAEQVSALLGPEAWARIVNQALQAVGDGGGARAAGAASLVDAAAPRATAAPEEPATGDAAQDLPDDDALPGAPAPASPASAPAGAPTAADLPPVPAILLDAPAPPASLPPLRAQILPELSANAPPPKLLVCPTCWRDAAELPHAARFCPRCGGVLPPRDANGYLVPPDESSPLFPVYNSLKRELTAKLAAEGTHDQEATSLIILAYANALLNLGWQYEHGQGLLRNPAEAARCYQKAGRLASVVAPPPLRPRGMSA